MKFCVPDLSTGSTNFDGLLDIKYIGDFIFLNAFYSF